MRIIQQQTDLGRNASNEDVHSPNGSPSGSRSRSGSVPRAWRPTPADASSPTYRGPKSSRFAESDRATPSSATEPRYGGNRYRGNRYRGTRFASSSRRDSSAGGDGSSESRAPGSGDSRASSGADHSVGNRKAGSGARGEIRDAAESSLPRRVLAESSRHLWFLLALVVIVALVLLAFSLLLPSEPAPVISEPVALLETATGSVIASQGTPGSARLLRLDSAAPIAAGTVIETRSLPETSSAGVSLAGLATGSQSAAAAPGRASLRLTGGQSVRVDTDSRVRIESSSTLVLERGAVYVDTAEMSAEDLDQRLELARGGIEVRTVFGVVRDIGTQFEVRLVESDAGSLAVGLRVRVREGLVVLEHDSGDRSRADAGSELTVSDEGDVVVGRSAIYGPNWDWVLDAAPVPEVEGWRLEAFLDWTVREGGWSLRYTGREMRDRAATTVLHGDLGDLSLMQATSVALAGSDLEYTLEQGELVIDDRRRRGSPR